MTDNNLYYNKIEVDGDVKIDLTDDTIEPSTLLHGYTAHAASGAPITGELIVNDDHQALHNRDAANSHPTSAITGLDLALEELNGKVAEKQDTIIDLPSIRSGATLGATAVQPEAGKGLSSNDYTTAEKTKLAGLENYDDTAVVTDISEIKGKISQQATPSNKLVSQSEMGDAISLVEAKQLYATSAQGSFATKAALLAATVFYNADGTVATPTKNDVAYVLSDESHDRKSAKYVIATDPVDEIVWGFVITYSDVAFTQAQMSAINSGITAASVEAIAENTSDITELSEIVDTKMDQATDAESDNIAVFDTDGNVKDGGTSISDLTTAINGKEAKGKLTISGVQTDISLHTVTITTDGVTTTFSLVGVNS